jgi:hypothetical protein
MIIYEVTSLVDAEAADDYRTWLGEHVAAMLRFDGFEHAVISELHEMEEWKRGFVVSCYLTDMASLDRYLAEHAAAMRADGQRRFGGRFTATRRVHTILDELRPGS